MADWLDQQEPSHRQYVSVGTARVAMALNGLGFSNRRLYLTPQFYTDKPVEHLLGPGIQTEEPLEHWTLTPPDLQGIWNKSGATRLGFAVALKYFHHEGRFPRGCHEVPWLIVAFVATQVQVDVEAWHEYRWDNRAATYHRSQIHEALGFREAASTDAVVAWLLTEVVTTKQRPAHLIDQVMRRCKQQHIEPPADGRIQRFIDLALPQFETQLDARTAERLSASKRDAMDALIHETDELLPVPSAHDMCNEFAETFLPALTVAGKNPEPMIR